MNPERCTCRYCTIREAYYDGIYTRTEARLALMRECGMTDAEAYAAIVDID